MNLEHVVGEQVEPVAALTEKQDKPLKLEEHSSLSERIERERERIMRAMAVIDVCRRATASMYDNDDPEMMAGALATASDLLNSVAGALEGIAKATQVSASREDAET